ncbi:MAG: FCD domain-containing protein [Blautia sp.]
MKLLYEASGSKMLDHVLSDFHQYVQRVQEISTLERMPGSEYNQCSEHRQILEAHQTSRNADLAEQRSCNATYL